MPPDTGPAISAAWNVIELRATSHGRSSGATTSAGSERAEGAMKARATPNATTRAKIGPTASRPDDAYQARAKPQTASPAAAMETTRRRSKRSATGPLTNTSSAAGANSARPSRPRLSSSPVRSNTCLPSAVTAISEALEVQKEVTSNAVTERVQRRSPPGPAIGARPYRQGHGGGRRSAQPERGCPPRRFSRRSAHPPPGPAPR